MNTLEYARLYVSKGFSVIPLEPKGKRPIVPSWREYQETHPTEEELVKWFGNEDETNIGIVTGKISNIVVVDCDSQIAVEFSKDNHFPKAPSVKTGKPDGYHLYYAYPENREIRNFQKRDDLPDIDLRADGGYVVAPPSIHSTGAQYKWLPRAGLDIPFAPLPEILLTEKTDNKTPLRDLYKGVPEGKRNDSLTRLVGSWANDGLSFDECLENAYLWNSKNDPPLPEKEIVKTVSSIFQKHQKTAEKPTDKEITTDVLLLSLFNKLPSLLKVQL